MDYAEIFELKNKQLDKLYKKTLAPIAGLEMETRFGQYDVDWYRSKNSMAINQTYNELLAHYPEEDVFSWFVIIATECLQQEIASVNEKVKEETKKTQNSFLYELSFYQVAPFYHTVVCNNYPLLIIDVRKKEIVDSFDGYFRLEKEWNGEKEGEWQAFYRQITYFLVFLLPIFNKLNFFSTNHEIKNFLNKGKKMVRKPKK